MDAKGRVVVTGLGMINPLGGEAEVVWTAVNRRKTGLAETPPELREEVVSPVCGYVRDIDPAKILTSRKAAKLMGRDSLLGIKAAREAIHDAGFYQLPAEQDRFGLYVSTGLTYGAQKEIFPLVDGAMADTGISMHNFGSVSLSGCNPLLSFKILPNMPACHISIELGLTGPNMVFNPWPVQGAQAVGEAFAAIRCGLLDYALVGSLDSRLHMAGVQTMDWEGVVYRGGFPPAQSSRPFARNRSGVVPSEGAAFLVLESLESARGRKARIYAEVLAYGQFNALTNDDNACRSAILASTEQVLGQAGIDAADVDLVFSSAASCPVQDCHEGAAIKQTFGSGNTNVWCPKAFYGELGASSHATSLALAALALSGQRVPPALNRYECEFGLPYTGGPGYSRPIRYCLANAFEASCVKACILLGRVGN